MRTSAVFVYSLLALVPNAALHESARADAIGPTPPCEPGMARGGRDAMGDLGAWAGHGGGPRCEPAVCSDASTCGPRQVCRRDAHCIAPRETLVDTSHGHSASRPVPMMLDFDLGLCEDDGACPEGSRCLEVSTCRASRAPDTAMAASVFGSAGGTRAAGAWSFATPPEGAPTPTPIAESAVEPVPAAGAPTEDAVPEGAVVLQPHTPATTSAPAASAPATGCGCSVARRSPAGLLLAFGCALGARWSRRRAQRDGERA